jgi:hypothetical protein
MTNQDFGNVRGIDVRLDRRFSNLFSGAIAYTFQMAKSTGSDPFSYTTLLGREISSLTGETSPPPQSILPTDDNRTHNITGSMQLQFPNNWKSGSTIGSIFKNVGAFATFRFASGLPYTLLRPQTQGLTLVSRCGLACQTSEPINSSTLPWFENVDLRLTKGIRVRHMDWTLFAEAKNLFNFQNIVDVFLETGTTTYADYEAKFLDEQTGLLQGEAKNSGGILGADGSINFNQLGGCNNWTNGPVDCVLLERAEARYGNGDGIFTPTEYKAAFTGWYNLQNAQSRFYGTGRRLRLGAQLSF